MSIIIFGATEKFNLGGVYIRCVLAFKNNQIEWNRAQGSGDMFLP